MLSTYSDQFCCEVFCDSDDICKLPIIAPGTLVNDNY